MSIPEQYKTGIAYFMDFEFKVSPDTLIPRPETELLVEKVIETANKLYDLRLTTYNLQILDIGTGCGNIAISLTKYIPQSRITALDISDEALIKAKQNAFDLGVSDKIDFIKSNLFDSLEYSVKYDIIVSNPPYVSKIDMGTLPEEVNEEPPAALYGGVDGLDFYKKIIRGAPKFLKKNGFLIMEMGYDQSLSVQDILKDSGYRDIEIFKDYSGIDRIAKASK